MKSSFLLSTLMLPLASVAKTAQNIHIGVYMANDSQVLDTAAVDILGCMSKQFISTLPRGLPPNITWDQVPDVKVSYITADEQGQDMIMSSDMVVRATHTIDDEEVAPGKLDMVVVPGPSRWNNLDKRGLDWVREQYTKGVDILSICTGIFICCDAGIASGKKATGPKPLQKLLKAKYPDVDFQGDKYRYLQDGNFWSSGSVTNGNDLLAAYARASSLWPQPIVEMILDLMDTGNRGQTFANVKF
ncbi:hypothetical protein CDD81_2663 [Ophiocordyceps australis]|uniref:DJ-1/PfpI domain-containing protein n=1 Tax=Ophiocordyceps australis TaxID=1399860 RepID=A0A2C5XYJ7_9HYPO|nr:hypothetical protein CDD81_2663 [Ophiocordyceps australis]